MKVISKKDLLLIISMIKDREDFDLEDLKQILERFGDDWYAEDGKFQKVKENEEMNQLRDSENKSRCYKCVRFTTCPSHYRDDKGTCLAYKKDPPDGGYYG